MFGYLPQLSGDLRDLGVDSPLHAVRVFPTLVPENWGENRTVLSVLGRQAEHANSELSPFVFLCLYVICRLGTH